MVNVIGLNLKDRFAKTDIERKWFDLIINSLKYNELNHNFNLYYQCKVCFTISKYPPGTIPDHCPKEEGGCGRYRSG